MLVFASMTPCVHKDIQTTELEPDVTVIIVPEVTVVAPWWRVLVGAPLLDPAVLLVAVPLVPVALDPVAEELTVDGMPVLPSREN